MTASKPRLRELLPELRLLRVIPLPPVSKRTLKFQRRSYGTLQNFLVKSRPAPSTVDVTDEIIRSDDGKSIPLRIYEPSAAPRAPRAVMLWIHGGGMVLDDHRDDSICGRFASQLDMAVVSVDYRVAPEYPFPGPLNDLVCATEWVRDKAQSTRFDKGHLVLAGASAGGGLAASLAQRLTDSGIPVAGQLLVFPMLDDRTAARADIGPKQHLVWNNAANQFGWSSYLGCEPGSESVPHYAVPARRAEVSGLPPAWIGVGTLDLFLDEDVKYAERLLSAGVDCTLEIVPGATHMFDVIAPKSEVTAAFNESQHVFLRKIVGRR
jgi:acetyl esterase/lipase